jgi:hypothetical protein
MDIICITEFTFLCYCCELTFSFVLAVAGEYCTLLRSVGERVATMAVSACVS